MFILKFLSLFLFLTISTFAQTARLQVIHNAADPIAAAVDVYLNGTKAIDDFAFRTATPFIDVQLMLTLMWVLLRRAALR